MSSNDCTLYYRIILWPVTISVYSRNYYGVNIEQDGICKASTHPMTFVQVGKRPWTCCAQQQHILPSGAHEECNKDLQNIKVRMEFSVDENLVYGAGPATQQCICK